MLTNLKTQAVIDTAIGNLNSAEIADLTNDGIESGTFARLVQASDPYWGKAIVAHLQS